MSRNAAASARCFSDCLMIELARQAGCAPLLTFDRDLARIDGAELITS